MKREKKNSERTTETIRKSARKHKNNKSGFMKQRVTHQGRKRNAEGKIKRGREGRKTLVTS